jgi:hypothetical protein
MLSARLLGGQARVREEHRRVLRLDGNAVRGRTPAEIASVDGRAVLAVQRGGELFPSVDSAFRIENGDFVWVCSV